MSNRVQWTLQWVFTTCLVIGILSWMVHLWYIPDYYGNFVSYVSSRFWFSIKQWNETAYCGEVSDMSLDTVYDVGWNILNSDGLENGFVSEIYSWNYQTWDYEKTVEWTGILLDDENDDTYTSSLDNGEVESYWQEKIDAYHWAFLNWITTQDSLQSANLDWKVTRQAAAKMLVIFAKNVLNKSIDEKSRCIVKWDITEDLQSYVNQACQLWIMWDDWKEFNAKGSLTRAQFWTILSRLLWGDLYEGSSPYYKGHLDALKSLWIITSIADSASKEETRGNVFVVLKRIADMSDTIIDFQASFASERVLAESPLVDEDSLLSCKDKSGEMAVNTDSSQWVYSYNDWVMKHVCTYFEEELICRNENWEVDNFDTTKIEFVCEQGDIKLIADDEGYSIFLDGYLLSEF